MSASEKVVIIGSGPAGLTAGIYAGRADLAPLIIDGREPGGQLMTTTAVENWPGHESILGPDLMKRIREQAVTCGARILSDEVVSVNFKDRPFSLTLKEKGIVHTNAVIVATGAQPKKLGVPGEDTYWGKGVSTCAICDGPFFRDKRVVIVGGGDSAMESASFLSIYTKDITLVHILPKLTASQAMQKRVLNNPDIKIIYESTVSEIKGNGQRVQEVSIKNQKTGTLTMVQTEGVFIAIGLNPATSLFKGQLDMDAYGYLLLKNHTETSVPGIFAAGDVADKRYRQAITSAGSGCAAALDAERYLKESSL
jgi:thioredoxin reductase (NADPH)